MTELAQRMHPEELADLSRLAGRELTEDEAESFRRRLLNGQAVERMLEDRRKMVRTTPERRKGRAKKVAA